MHKDKDYCLRTNQNRSRKQIHPYWKDPQTDKIKSENEKQTQTGNQERNSNWESVPTTVIVYPVER